MGNLNRSNQLRAGRIARPLLAVSLAASLAALGCTTNQTLGNGTPTRTPEVRTAPTSGVTSGSETNTPPSNPPMTSSYTRSDVLPPVTPRSGVVRRSPDEAAAIMAGHQALRGRYLGVTNPGSAGRPYASDNIRTFIPPAMLTNPQRTINSSISSPSGAGIISGAGEPVGGVTLTPAGTVAGATIAGTGLVDPTPTTAAAGIPVGAIAGSAPLPTMTSAGLPSVTAASAGTRATPATAATTPATTAASTVTTTPIRSGSITSPVRVVRGTSGTVTVTNVGTGRSQ